MATQSSILVWRTSWTGEPGGIQSVGLQRTGHDWAHSTTYKNKSLSGKGKYILKLVD